MFATRFATPWRVLVHCAVVVLTGLLACIPAQGRTASELRETVVEKLARVAPRAHQSITTQAGGLVEVVEFYNASLLHYFISADPAEIAVLDGGAFGGAWKRTGNTFPAWDVNGAPAATLPVCRFFGTDQYRADGSRIGPNSHFYTADPAECAFVKTAYTSLAGNGLSYPAWTYEANAFAVGLPSGGACAAGTQPLYRTYNNGERGDPNHRYSSNAAALQGMVGWTFEGLVMCVPLGAAVTLPPALAGCGGACPAGTTLGNGLGLVNAIVQVVNTSEAPLELAIPRGQTFVSATPSVQSGIALETLRATVAPGTTRTFVLALFCINAHLSPSNTGSTYAPGPVTTNPALLELASMADGKLGAASDPIGLKNLALQNAVWEITDGSGVLTVAQKGLLAAILATPGDDPAIYDLIKQFLESFP